MSADEKKTPRMDALEARVAQLEARLAAVEASPTLTDERALIAGHATMVNAAAAQRVEKEQANQARLADARQRAEQRPRVRITIAPRPPTAKAWDWPPIVKSQRNYRDALGDREHLLVDDKTSPILIEEQWDLLCVADDHVRAMRDRGVLVATTLTIQETTRLEMERAR